MPAAMPCSFRISSPRTARLRRKLDAKAVVTLVPGTGITGSAITLVGTVPGIDAAKFKELADKAKAECPVSKALGAIKVSLDAKLG